LNAYFDAMSEPIARHGGEILKFIGDGLLAIFPLSQPSACANLLHAVAEGRQAMVALNEKNGKTGRASLSYGIGVHVGDVMYGNIGSRTRLDFTVIGPAVNMASRLEALTGLDECLLMARNGLIRCRSSQRRKTSRIRASERPSFPRGWELIWNYNGPDHSSAD